MTSIVRAASQVVGIWFSIWWMIFIRPYTWCWEKIFGSKENPSGRSVFITGCDSGLGYIAAKYLSSQGFRVFAGCLSLDSEGAKRLGEECSTVQTVQCDVCNYESVMTARKTIDIELSKRSRKQESGGGQSGLWAIVNVAGLSYFGNIEIQSYEDIKAQVETNLLGSMAVCKALLPLVRSSKGRIINVSCVSANSVLPISMDAYAAAKAGVLHLSNCLRQSLDKFGVKVVTFVPGMIAGTDMVRYSLIRKGQQWLSAAEDGVKDAYGETNFTNGGSKEAHAVAKAMNSKDWRHDDKQFESFRNSLSDAVLSRSPSYEYAFGQGAFVFPLMYNFLPWTVYTKVAPWFTFVLE